MITNKEIAHIRIITLNLQGSHKHVCTVLFSYLQNYIIKVLYLLVFWLRKFFKFLYVIKCFDLKFFGLAVRPARFVFLLYTKCPLIPNVTRQFVAWNTSKTFIKPEMKTIFLLYLTYIYLNISKFFSIWWNTLPVAQMFFLFFFMF